MLPLPQSPSSAEVFLEREEDAVFGVRLRRVTYNSGLTDSFLQWQTEKVRTLRAATVERLVRELLPADGNIDPTFLITFLGTYRTFMTAEGLVAMIRARISEHCQLHSLTTISRSSSEASVGSASTERSRSGLSVSSVEDITAEAGDVLALEVTPAAFDDDDLVGTEELVRTVMSRSYSMSTVGRGSYSTGGGGVSPGLSGRPSVSQRVKMFSLLSSHSPSSSHHRGDRSDSRPVARNRATTTGGVHGVGCRADSDMGSSCDSNVAPLLPRTRTGTSSHARHGSDGAQRDSGNGTESQEESNPSDPDCQPRKPLGARRRLPFTKAETSAYGEEPCTESDRSVRGDEWCGVHGVRPVTSAGFTSTPVPDYRQLGPRSRSFSPVPASARSYTMPSQGFSRPASRTAFSQSVSPDSSASPNRFAGASFDTPSPVTLSPSPIPDTEDLDDSDLEATMIDDDLPPAAADDDGERTQPSSAQNERSELADQSTVSSSVDEHGGSAGGGMQAEEVVQSTTTLIKLHSAEAAGGASDPEKQGEDDVEEEEKREGSSQLEESFDQRRYGPDPKDIFKSVLSVLRVWLDQYPEDFKTPQRQMHLFGLLEECRISPGQEFDDVYSLAEVLSNPEQDDITSPLSAAASIRKSNTLVNLHQRHRSTLALQGALGADSSTMPRSYIDFLSIPPMKLAKQLTLIDAGLFRKVVPYHCLAHFWSRRNSSKEDAETCPSVSATIEQFNRVCMLLSTSLVKGMQHRRVAASKENKPHQRAKIIQHWIDIAQCCRILKNFSSLRAIISQLQSVAITRMHRMWSLVDKDSMLLFRELCTLSSFSNNDQKTRAMLMKEGTSKYSGFDQARTAKSPRGKFANRFSDVFTSSTFIVQGVVPYLGTFLTDLTMVDSAHSDRTEENWLNFQKRRKEFELLAQLMLFQKACKYEFENDTMIQSWMLRADLVSDDECYRLSMELEPEQAENRFGKTSGPSWKSRFKRTINISSKPKKMDESVEGVVLLKGDSSTPPAHGISNRLFRSSVRAGKDKDGQQRRISNGSQDSSTGPSSSSNGDTAGLGRVEEGGGSATASPTKKRSISNSEAGIPEEPRPSWDEWFKDAHLARVRMETDSNHGAYKSFLLNNGDRARSVIERVLEKNRIDEKREAFTLYQIISATKEIRIPMDANVFYAINTRCDHFDFVLRHCDRRAVKSICTSAPGLTAASKWTPLPE